MKKRGAALPTVLALVSAVLIAGLAMGSLSTLSLQFNRRHMDSTRTELAARSGLARFLAQVHRYEAQEDQAINPLEPKSLEMTDIFPNGLDYTEGDYRVVMHFDTQRDGFSSDNLSGEVPKVGYFDKDGVPRIPPYGLDLVVTVHSPTRTYHYRAILKRYWPYAVYTKHGTMAFFGQPDLTYPHSTTLPSHVEGDLYTNWRVTDDAGQLINYGTLVDGYGLGELTDPDKILANREARAGYQPSKLPYHPLIIGMRGYVRQAPRRKYVRKRPTSDPDEILYAYEKVDADEWPHSWGDTESVEAERPYLAPYPASTTFFNDVGSVVDGDFYYSHEIDQPIGAVIVEPSNVGPSGENKFNGEIHLKRAPHRDPLEGIENNKAFSTSGFTALNIPPPDGTLWQFAADVTTGGNSGVFDSSVFETNNDDGSEPALLTETLRLTESENSLGGPTSPHYVIEGSASNRQTIYDKASERLFVREMFAGLELQGVTLRVEGDLDLGAGAFAEDGKSIPISGSGATLIVDGQLTLGNAQINAGDQGFVMYAKDIVLKGGGDFRGLLIAKNSITVLSQGKTPLRIEGGVMCAGEGGIVLRGAEIKHEQRFLKAVNGAGDFYMASWRKQ